jgi:pyruvate/2-oxoglutarate dehydrogenase complex dihydrolipoamide dehydrogenase (E3) component
MCGEFDAEMERLRAGMTCEMTGCIPNKLLFENPEHS